MYDELSAFIGLIVIELQNFRQGELKYKEDEQDYTKMVEIREIIEILHFIQEMLDKKQVCGENINKINRWTDKYVLGENIIKSLTSTFFFPTGYCFVAKAVCNRMEKNKLIDVIQNFLEVLGFYIKYYYYDY